MQRQPRLSPATLETLATIAYRQPVGRAEIEEIRGVNSGGVLRTLQERGLIEVVGRSEALGRPLLYGTTRALPRDCSASTISPTCRGPKNSPSRCSRIAAAPDTGDDSALASVEEG